MGRGWHRLNTELQGRYPSFPLHVENILRPLKGDGEKTDKLCLVAMQQPDAEARQNLIQLGEDPANHQQPSPGWSMKNPLTPLPTIIHNRKLRD